MKVIGITGMPGSGKTEVAKLAKKRGIPVVRMGDLVWKEVRRRGLGLNDKSVGKIATEMRKGNPAIWAVKTIEVIEHLRSKTVVIDGIRSGAEVERFRSAFPNFQLVAINASQKTRFERISGRGREDDITNRRAFVERDKREIRWGLGEVIALADTVIINESSLEVFRRNIAGLFE